MPTALMELRNALAAFSSTSRLYGLTVGDGDDDGRLLVEAFRAEDAVDAIGVRELIVLSTSVHADLDSLLGQSARLGISLADGTRAWFGGEIVDAAMLGSDGGFARYRLRLMPWLWRLDQVRNSRVWQDKSVIDIVDEVFRAYQPAARWRWSDDTLSFMDGAIRRSYCCQYRESDFGFVRRLLQEEGLSWRFDDEDDAPCMVIFADSRRRCAVPEDPSCAREGAIRYHGVSAVERQDTVQSLASRRSLHATLTTLLSCDYKVKQAVAAGAPSLMRFGRQLPELEIYDTPGQYAYANREQARRHADLRMQAMEARGQQWQGRSTVRTLRAGSRLSVSGMPRADLGEVPALTVLRVSSVGINNLPAPAQHALAELFGAIPELLQDLAPDGEREPEGWPLVIDRARKSGYANSFEAIPTDLPWRSQLTDEAHERPARPTACGAQTAIVVGADGSGEPSGADELYCDYLGRVRIRFHWQDEDASCWVRVAQRAAGGGMGSQFLPRIGQEVLVQFLEHDIDRPIIVGALYNGRGEGGVPPTPGGAMDVDHDTSVFARAHDRAVAGQGNLAGGNSPVWHGASVASDGHRNAGAQWGVRSKEFGGSGYNQLLFDDTDAQGRVQLRCTHAATELNLGHLIHSADNYRGSLRGLGSELRTDGCGAVRAGSGLLVTSYGLDHNASARDPSGENAAGLGMLERAAAQVASFHTAALTHQAVGLAAHAGAAKPDSSLLDDQAAPLKAMQAALSGTVQVGSATVPHLGAPLVAISAREGFGAVAAQSVQLASGETVSLVSGKDAQFVSGGLMRVHAGQAIGVLGGAVKAGEGGLGLQLIAAKEAIDIQAQADELKVQARDEVNVVSANAHVDWAAAKRISLSTAGGANITIEGGNIVVQCPGKMLVRAGKKSFLGPEKSAYDMPALPRSVCVACLKKALAAGLAFTMAE